MNFVLLIVFMELIFLFIQRADVDVDVRQRTRFTSDFMSNDKTNDVNRRE